MNSNEFGMNLCEFWWILMNLNECWWIYVIFFNLSKFVWIFVNLNEFVWILMNFNKFVWIWMKSVLSALAIFQLYACKWHKSSMQVAITRKRIQWAIQWCSFECMFIGELLRFLRLNLEKCDFFYSLWLFRAKMCHNMHSNEPKLHHMCAHACQDYSCREKTAKIDDLAADMGDFLALT